MRDCGPAGRGRRKAGDGDGDGEEGTREGVETEREEDGAEGASWREAASELVVDLTEAALGQRPPSLAKCFRGELIHRPTGKWSFLKRGLPDPSIHNSNPFCVYV